jgi:hypothetical protein
MPVLRQHVFWLRADGPGKRDRGAGNEARLIQATTAKRLAR